eukprot:scaffold373_cov350-Pavlova_lutheri.AAC.14
MRPRGQAAERLPLRDPAPSGGLAGADCSRFGEGPPPLRLSHQGSGPASFIDTLAQRIDMARLGIDPGTGGGRVHPGGRRSTAGDGKENVIVGRCSSFTVELGS